MNRSYAIVLILVLSLLAFSACAGPVATPTPTASPTPPGSVLLCKADFSAEPTECDGPTWVQFTDLSTGLIISWEWDFGDGGNSTERSPKHFYNENGSYSVTLTVTGPDCEDTLHKPDYIEVSGCKT